MHAHVGTANHALNATVSSVTTLNTASNMELYHPPGQGGEALTLPAPTLSQHSIPSMDKPGANAKHQLGDESIEK